MLFTISAGPIGGKASAGAQRSRIQAPTVVWIGAGESQPMKCVPVLVTMLNRGEPAPQCDPRRSVNASGFRMS